MTVEDVGFEANSIEIDATLIEREDVRFTPAGIEVFDAVVHHRSRLVEAGIIRTLEYDFEALSYGDTASRLNALAVGAKIRIKGFLATKSMKSRRLTVHITEFK